jgi:hypothetical protein
MRELAQHNLSTIGRIFRQFESVLPQRYVRDKKIPAPKRAGIVPVGHASKLAASRRSVWSNQLTHCSRTGRRLRYCCIEGSALFQRGVDRREPGIQLGADAVHDGNDGKRNPSGDQSIFDCRGRCLVSPKFPDQCDHGRDGAPPPVKQL